MKVRERKLKHETDRIWAQLGTTADLRTSERGTGSSRIRVDARLKIRVPQSRGQIGCCPIRVSVLEIAAAIPIFTTHTDNGRRIEERGLPSAESSGHRTRATKSPVGAPTLGNYFTWRMQSRRLELWKRNRGPM